MFEAKLTQGSILKKVVDSLKDLLNEASFNLSNEGIVLESIDSSHVTLVSLLLRADGFEKFRCDRNMPVGINMSSLSKIMRAAGNDDSITLRADDNGDCLGLVFEAPNGGRVCDYDLKLIDLNGDGVGVPEMEYDVSVRISSDEFQRICRDLSALGESVTIEANKEAVRFSVSGDVGSGSISLKNLNGDSHTSTTGKESSSSSAGTTSISIKNPASISVSLKFLSQFTKAGGLSDSVRLEFSDDAPMMVDYQIGDLGYVRYYLAPKCADDDM